MGYSERDHIGSAQVISPRFMSKIRRFLWFPYNQGFQVGMDTPVEVSRRVVTNRLKKATPRSFFTAHVGYSTGLLDAVLAQGIYPIVVHRDPRAVLVSFVHYVARLEEHVLHQEFKLLSEEEQFAAVLNGHRFKKAYLEPLRTRCMALDGWMASDKVLKIRFEDLVGEKGGGTADSQKETLTRLCDWLEIPTPPIEQVTEELFGPGRHTFRKGQIASWKDELPKNLIKQVDEKLSDVLELWGYVDLYKELEV
jgi:hypothetical protein